MRRIIRFAIVGSFILLFAGNLFADINLSGLFAYPVPFNPKKASTKLIKLDGGPTSGSYSIKMEVFDINGDIVISRSFNGVFANVQWNARNEKGTLVSPGMYIMKLSAEENSTGDFGKKIIRILIAY